MKVYRLTEKGQVTVPLEVREALGLGPGSLVEMWADGDEVRMRRVEIGASLGPDDPIRELIGLSESGRRDVSLRHDHYLAQGETARWRASSSTRVRSTRSSTAATGTTGRRSRSSKG